MILQSLGYVHHALHRWFARKGDRAAFTGTRSAYIDAADLALSPGSIGYDRRRGNTAVELVPDVCFYMERGYEPLRRIKPRWSAKRPKFVWRGSTTGAGSLDRQSIVDLPRYRLCSASLRSEGRVDAGFTNVVQARSREDAAGLQSFLVSQGLWREWMELGELARYKYIIDIDGNAGSWSFFKKLLTGSCVVKVHSFHEQWFSHELTPWVHYVPVEHDLSDFDEVVSWCFQNDDRCRAIGEAGRAFALEKDFASQMSLTASAIIGAAAPAV